MSDREVAGSLSRGVSRQVVACKPNLVKFDPDKVELYMSSFISILQYYDAWFIVKDSHPRKVEEKTGVFKDSYLPGSMMNPLYLGDSTDDDDDDEPRGGVGIKTEFRASPGSQSPLLGPSLGVSGSPTSPAFVAGNPSTIGTAAGVGMADPSMTAPPSMGAGRTSPMLAAGRAESGAANSSFGPGDKVDMMRRMLQSADPQAADRTPTTVTDHGRGEYPAVDSRIDEESNFPPTRVKSEGEEEHSQMGGASSSTTKVDLANDGGERSVKGFTTPRPSSLRRGGRVATAMGGVDASGLTPHPPHEQETKRTDESATSRQTQLPSQGQRAAAKTQREAEVTLSSLDKQLQQLSDRQQEGEDRMEKMMLSLMMHQQQQQQFMMQQMQVFANQLAGASPRPAIMDSRQTRNREARLAHVPEEYAGSIGGFQSADHLNKVFHRQLQKFRKFWRPSKQRFETLEETQTRIGIWELMKKSVPDGLKPLIARCFTFHCMQLLQFLVSHQQENETAVEHGVLAKLTTLRKAKELPMSTFITTFSDMIEQLQTLGMSFSPQQEIAYFLLSLQGDSRYKRIISKFQRKSDKYRFYTEMIPKLELEAKVFGDVLSGRRNRHGNAESNNTQAEANNSAATEGGGGKGARGSANGGRGSRIARAVVVAPKAPTAPKAATPLPMENSKAFAQNLLFKGAAQWVIIASSLTRRLVN